MLLPAINATCVNLVSMYVTDVISVAPPYDNSTFTVLNNEKCKPKKYPFAMLAIELDFDHPSVALKYFFN